MPPHFLALHEKGIPVINARVYGEQPAFWFGGRLCHPSKSAARNIHGKVCKMDNFIGGIFGVGTEAVKLRLSPALAYIYEDIVAADFHPIRLASDGRVGDQFSGGDVVLPPVPGASDDLPVKLAPTQWPSTVEA